MTKRLFSLIVCVFTLVSPLANSQSQQRVKTDLADKYYRQALYFYFQGEPVNALTQVERTKLRFGQLNDHTRLLQAGLQVSLGLHTQAQQSLLQFNHNYLNDTDGQEGQRAPELLLVAQLSLAEQFIEQGKNIEAQQTLASISVMYSRYHPQYTMLNQLAYWPGSGKLIVAEVDTSTAFDEPREDSLFTPYIQLNTALKFIENGDFMQAVDLLNVLKVSTWFAREQTFWQLLFSSALLSFDNASLIDSTPSATEKQSQGINDYAQLLLAQVYVLQEKYESAYFELQSFPQHSPYRESALYLFALAAQESKRYTSAFNIFSLLHKQYPYSHLSWQAGELLAEQLTEQQSLAHGLQAYQLLETFYQQRLTELDGFEQLPYQNIDTANSIWLKQALQSASLSHLYQELVEVAALTKKLQSLQAKSHWLAETISLNQQRKSLLLTSQKHKKQQVLINNLTQQRNELADKLSAVNRVNVINKKTQGNNIQIFGTAFANDVERQWLKRINKSKRSLSYISKHSDKSSVKQQTKLTDYQHRLNRVQGLLKWQLNQQFPERAWQHKKQLKTIDTLLADTQRQQEKNLAMSQSQHSLSKLIEQQLQGSAQVKRLLAKSHQLHEDITSNITNTVNQFIKQERQLIAQHQLSTKRAMANIIETMTVNDSKVEQQLKLSISPQKTEARP